ncbi:unnamed protein product [Blepharisma stoltei]|uniref:Calcineurin-like phosphoesterase domain-containing protein n=1 Tax=Blepharisma stoltei TaxID=1481888 RepID=A0AAU9J7Y3_9CILI|nr:unnamed protein product [Blepharisma stoltei]
MQSEQIRVHRGEIEKSEEFIRFVCLSDTHNQVGKKFKVPDGDVLLHAGDFTNCGGTDDVVNFNNFLGRLPHRYKVVIAGNHDLSFDKENLPTLIRNFSLNPTINSDATKALLTHCIYLEETGVEVFGYKIWGSPWTPTFYDWGFNAERGSVIAEKWRKIPEDTEILITHGPPYAILDGCDDGFHAGCEELKTAVERIKPKVHLFGHIHEAYGVYNNGFTHFINASTCTLRYRPTNPPIVFDLPRKS